MVAAPDRPTLYKRGATVTAWANATILLTLTSYIPSPDRGIHKAQSEGCRLWCVTVPMTTFAKVIS
jgi:hypothetical protein